MGKWIVAQKKRVILASAFIIPAVMMILVALKLDLYPFGRMSILMADMQCQFVDYIGYMKQIFFGEDDLLYSFSKTFGGDMSGFTSYYLSNPFYLILLLFPNKDLPAGIVWMMVIILGGCGYTFNKMINEIFGLRVSSLIFSTAYAFMGFMMAYMNCIHYFFSIMLLPFVILGLYRMMKKEIMSLLYVISLALAIISCYYMGYMIVIFTAMFFIYLSFGKLNEGRDRKEIIHVSWTVLYSTLLSVGISAFCLITTVVTLKGQKSSGISFALSRNFKLTDFFSGIYSNSFHGNISDGLPIIYCGIVTIIFLFFFFFDKTIKIRERIIALSLFLIMILSFNIDALNVVWHGFAHPIGFPYRNSFLFSFLALYFGYRGFLGIKNSFRKLYVAIFAVLFIEYSVYLFYSSNSYVGPRQIILNLLTVVLAVICISMMCHSRKYIVPAIVGLFVLQFIDLFTNGYKSVDSYFNDKDAYMDSLYAIDVYSDYIEETQKIINTIETDNPGMYRIDKMYRRSHNDPMMFGYNGLSHFSSCETTQVKEFMGKLGFAYNDLWAYYGNASTSFADCLMGLKYLISQYDETCKPYVQDFTYNNKFIFKNPYALSFGFGMKDTAKEIDMNESDPFILQNKMAYAFSAKEYNIYNPVDIKDIRLVNVKKDGNKYSIDNPDDEAYLEYQLKVPNDKFIYMYFDAPNTQSTELYVNELWKQPCFTTYDRGVRECGYFEPGSTANVKIVLKQDEIEIDKAYFYYEDTDELSAWYNDVSGTTCDIEKITSSHLNALVNVDDDVTTMAFSIPYEKDWTVKVDGREVETYRIMDALLALDIESGEHQIELMYMPRGLMVGIPISTAFLIITIALYIYERKKIKSEYYI